MTLQKTGDYIFRKSLKKILVLKKMKEQNLIDLVVFTGSFIRGNSDTISDVDLFIVLPLKIQKDFNLKTKMTP